MCGYFKVNPRFDIVPSYPLTSRFAIPPSPLRYNTKF